MGFHVRGAVLLFAIVVSACSLAAQQPVEGMLPLQVTVTSKSGDSVKNLPATAFTVTVNKAVQPVSSFREVNGSQFPTEVVIVLDAVNAPYTRVQFARDQIAQFLGGNQGHLAYPTSIAVLLDSGTQVVPKFTQDGNSLRDALSRLSIGLRSINRDQGFYGAQDRFQMSLDALTRLVSGVASHPGRKVLVWVSPGWPLLSGPGVELSDTQSKHAFGSVVGLLTTMRKAQISVDVVNPFGAGADIRVSSYYESFLDGARNTNSAELGDLGLQVLGVQTGGQVLIGSNDITDMLQRCYAQNETVYEMSIPEAPGEHDNEYHQIKVKLSQSGLTAHTTTVYYARPVFPPLDGQQPIQATKTH